MTDKSKKKKGRVRQTRTSFQKTFDPHPGMVQSFSWHDRLPELVHVSMALVDHHYSTVKSDFHRISDYVNSKIKPSPPFHFNLSHTIKLVRQDSRILTEIFQTSFKAAFHQLLPFYHRLFQIPVEFEVVADPRLLMKGFNLILDGRADQSILCKYIMAQYIHYGQTDPFNQFNMNLRGEILQPSNVSRIMAIFPASVGTSENLDLDFCHDIWMHNYFFSPHISPPDNSKEDKKHLFEMKIEEYTNEFRGLYASFKEMQLIAIYNVQVAEVNMGFSARVSNLALDAVELVSQGKGEIAELVFRTVLENFIVGSWMLKRQDPELYQRYREYTVGRERFIGERIEELSDDEEIKKGTKKMVKDAIKSSGMNAINVAIERGDIFDLRIDQMADEVWGKDNMFYFLYKRTSEVVHGQWRVITKYHLEKSLNPLHNGLYHYNENPNKSAGLIPAFVCLGVAAKFLIRMLKDINSQKETNIAHPEELEKKLIDFDRRLSEQWFVYYNTYVNPEKDNQGPIEKNI